MINLNPERLRKELNKRATFNMEQKERILEMIDSGEIKTGRKPLNPLIPIMSSFIAIGILFILFNSAGPFNFLNYESDLVTDPNTKLAVGQVQEITSEMSIIHHSKYDDMDRGNRDFYDKAVVVDTQYYKGQQVDRGDIIVYKRENKDFGLTRIIALPGEEVKIVKGQFYINNKMLDTFYGRAHRVGMYIDALNERLEQGNFEGAHIEQNIKNMIEYFENMNEKAVIVPEGQVYVIGDDWFRTSKMGLFPKERILGKVLGYR